jgi:hypothetical protein
MTEVPRLPAQRVPETWHLGCISSCGASCAMVCVTDGSPGTHEPRAVPKTEVIKSQYRQVTVRPGAAGLGRTAL